ncbi:Gfo/Idh/MocA family oxidoreductase [uncultured Bacteroides sp.]|uniref:Gfo/Idh/MocA family protein n=1 Tax=uncultured Bacteroides sp. TaxID=162156 RepID=UPI0026231BF6|nr:Gfo/Idh/MocA family oxidoreductase [uncultured Bacteroides sp.]
MKKYKIGIIGSGWIAEKMAITLNGMQGVEKYAVASRSSEKAEAFARKWEFLKAFGSYEALADDPDVDLIYIATPHSLHYEQAKMCINKGKPVLCEKAFTANAREAEALLDLAHREKVFITEAIWTRYMPLSMKIQQLLKEGIIGTPYMLSANLSYPVAYKERIQRPELAGGALLDLGVYALNFAAMAFGSDIKETHSFCQLTESGVDAQENITLLYNDGKMASLQAGIYAKSDRMGVISGDKGHLIVENINCPEAVRVIDADYKTIAVHEAPRHITGYEYQVYASIEALENGWLESPYMPHAETLRIMKQMDALRKEWGVKYPCD